MSKKRFVENKNLPCRFVFSVYGEHVDNRLRNVLRAQTGSDLVPLQHVLQNTATSMIDGTEASGKRVSYISRLMSITDATIQTNQDMVSLLCPNVELPAAPVEIRFDVACVAAEPIRIIALSQLVTAFGLIKGVEGVLAYGMLRDRMIQMMGMWMDGKWCWWYRPIALTESMKRQYQKWSRDMRYARVAMSSTFWTSNEAKISKAYCCSWDDLSVGSDEEVLKLQKQVIIHGDEKETTFEVEGTESEKFFMTWPGVSYI